MQPGSTVGPRVTRVVCAQLGPSLGDLAGNKAMTLGAIRHGVSLGADIIVLPELATSGYVFQSVAEVEDVAISSSDPLFAEWAAAGGNAVVVGGFAERAEDGSIYNSAALVAGDGLRSVYRKTHLWDREKLYFTPGATAPPVVQTRFGAVAVIICYDLEFPELTRTVALAGAELIVVPTNWPLMDRPADERAAEVTIAMATARINRVAIACCDRTGSERGQDWTEGTSIIDADGWVVATSGSGVGWATAEIDLSLSGDKSLTALVDTFEDRRPELYGAVSAPRRTIAAPV